MIARALLFAFLIVAGPVAALAAPAGETLLPVPFLPQTEALCGGAAAAMVYRYWGDRHADVQQFAALVDRRAGGIRDTVLADAIRAKGWRAEQTTGLLDSLRASLIAKQPAIVLLEDRANRYHFVVIVGATASDIVVHDPTWGPNRRIPIATFARKWTAAHSWMLVVTPPPTSILQPPANPQPPVPASDLQPPTSTGQRECARLLDAALDEIEARGMTVADRALGDVRTKCPTAAGPLRELAAIRLVQKRPKEATTLGRAALKLDAADAYAWNVLGSSLFIQNDTEGALQAWNHTGTPQLDSLQISGLTRARYALIARVLDLTPNMLLTRHDYILAGRRLDQLPDRIVSRLALKPDTDGYATVTAAIQETTRRPQNLAEWGSAGLATAINREVTAAVAGWSGQGEVFYGSWRWWKNRPKVAGGFAAPRAGWFGGVLRVDGMWEAQTYDIGDAVAPVREDRRSGTVSLRNWLTPQLRYELHGGLDVWNRTDRTILTGVMLDQRFFGDRLSLAATFDHWSAIGSPSSVVTNDPATSGVFVAAPRADDFSSAGAVVSFRSRREPRGFVATALARLDVASINAPLALWSGAGEGRARPTLLRAHRLLHDGIVDGPIFGRRSVSTNVELQRWWVSELGAGGLALFTDMAAADDRLPSAHGRAFLADAGIGLRARLPGKPGLFRIDYGHGLLDDGQRVSAAWTTEF